MMGPDKPTAPKKKHRLAATSIQVPPDASTPRPKETINMQISVFTGIPFSLEYAGDYREDRAKCQ